MLLQALSKMSTVVGSDSAVIASLCTNSAPRLHDFDTQSLAQLFCASAKHAHTPHFASFASCACKQLNLRVASMDGVSAGCLAGALATASQNVAESDACYADLRLCMVALCSRWLMSPSLALGPQHTAFMCRCLVSSLSTVQGVVGDTLSIRGIRHRVADAVAGIVADVNWFCIAHVELLLILLSNSRKSSSTQVSWLCVPKKHKAILKATRKRMGDVTSSMLSAYESFDRDAASVLLDSLAADLPLLGSVLLCGAGGPGDLTRVSCFHDSFTDCCFVAGDEAVRDYLLKTRENVRIVSWSRSLGSQAPASPWLALDTKCEAALLRHPGCSSSCTMLLHMAVSGPSFCMSCCSRFSSQLC